MPIHSSKLPFLNDFVCFLRGGAAMASPNVQIIPINPHSDGDATRHPKPQWALVDPPHIYLEKLAVQWLEKRGERLAPGMHWSIGTRQIPPSLRLVTLITTNSSLYSKLPSDHLEPMQASVTISTDFLTATFSTNGHGLPIRSW